ncbi:MAG TPA: class I SAM-dependent methyltransferase [Vicinamibacterales bacterium]|nr:class I SAM-dependent methyltransferase [Vicinamibacterales bacterium]
MPDPIASGDYARKQIYCPSRVVAWSHGSRFQLAASLAEARRGGVLLDYGCGDGTFIALTHGTFSRAVGADVDRDQLAECRRRMGDLERVEFVETTTLADESHAHAFDLVTCMEVLEHCTDSERVRVVEELGRLCATDGQIVVSVPIEVGPALLGKQLFRAIAAWRGQGDYQHRETYSPGELMAAVCGRRDLARAEYVVETPSGPSRYCGHKGFDWRILEAELRTRFIVDRRMFTPIPALGALMNSQVWFVCRPRHGGSGSHDRR